MASEPSRSRDVGNRMSEAVMRVITAVVGSVVAAAVGAAAVVAGSVVAGAVVAVVVVVVIAPPWSSDVRGQCVRRRSSSQAVRLPAAAVRRAGEPANMASAQS